MRYPLVKIFDFFPLALPAAIEKLERIYVKFALRSKNGNKTHAAEFIGIKRTTLVAMMKRLGIPLNPPKKRRN